MTLVHIDAPHFYAGLELDASDRCVRAAPILAWAIGRDRDFLRAYFARKGWSARVYREKPVPADPATTE